MYLYYSKLNLVILLSCILKFNHTLGIQIGGYTPGFLSNNCNISKNKYGFLNNNINSYRKIINYKLINDKELRYSRINSRSDGVDHTNKYIDNFLRSEKGNLFKKQYSSYKEDISQISTIDKSKSWSEIVQDEILKNRLRLAKEDKIRENRCKEGVDFEVKKEPFNYRLTPEGRLKLEDRIEHLKRAASSNPVQYKEKTPILWIIRSSHGNYCELLKKDEPKIKSLVERVRKHFPKSELEILVMKVNIKMPLCEILLEGTMTDLVRIFYARGGTLQFYVVPRFWTRCEVLEKDPRLEATYGKSTAPGLFPQWDENGMLEEIADCLDARPDYALEFRTPNAWQMIPMMPEFDRSVMKAYFDHVHWPTRLKVQKAFESGLEDFRIFIEHHYKVLQKDSRSLTNTITSEPIMTEHPDKLLDLWL